MKGTLYCIVGCKFSVRVRSKWRLRVYESAVCEGDGGALRRGDGDVEAEALIQFPSIATRRDD